MPTDFWDWDSSARMRDRLNEKLLQSRTGHKTIAMPDRYSKHRIAGDREQIRQTQVDAFGGLAGEADYRMAENMEV
jgi:hypothetical protein